MTRCVYLAGPDVFHPQAAALAAANKALCQLHGFAPLYPGDQAETGAEAIYRANLAMIHRADAIVANLVPFRGAEPDSGTAFEIGFAVALGKPVVAYIGDGESCRQRVERLHGPCVRCPATGAWRDRDGNLVEEFGHAVNLMLAESCAVIVAGDCAAALGWLADHWNQCAATGSNLRENSLFSRTQISAGLSSG